MHNALIRITKIFGLLLVIAVMIATAAFILQPDSATAQLGDTDTDGDSVPDGQDLCPGTSPEDIVDSEGCTIDIPVDEPLVTTGTSFSSGGLGLSTSSPVSIFSFTGGGDFVELMVEAPTATSVTFTLSGLTPSTTYYRYRNDESQAQVTTDATGSVTFTETVDSEWLWIFLRTSPATTAITSFAGCPGTWDDPTRTCTLTADLADNAFIGESNFILDLGGFTIGSTTTSTTGDGLQIFLRDDVTVRNGFIAGFTGTGLRTSNSNRFKLFDVTIFDVGRGLLTSGCDFCQIGTSTSHILVRDTTSTATSAVFFLDDGSKYFVTTRDTGREGVATFIINSELTVDIERFAARGLRFGGRNSKVINGRFEAIGSRDFSNVANGNGLTFAMLGPATGRFVNHDNLFEGNLFSNSRLGMQFNNVAPVPAGKGPIVVKGNTFVSNSTAILLSGSLGNSDIDILDNTIDATNMPINLGSGPGSNVLIAGNVITSKNRGMRIGTGTSNLVIRDNDITSTNVGFFTDGLPVGTAIFHNVVRAQGDPVRAFAPQTISNTVTSEGNNWGRVCTSATTDLFIPGIDSNRLDVDDPFAYSIIPTLLPALDVWNFGASPGCTSDIDGDTVFDWEDDCPLVAGRPEYDGCPVADENIVTLHVVDQAKIECGGKGSCKFPLANAEVKVFDRDLLNGLTITTTGGPVTLTKNPGGTLYPDIFEDATANTNAIVGSCTTDSNGRCLVGEEQVGNYLVLVKSVDVISGKTAYTGLPKSPEDYVDTNGDGIGDLATKDFPFVKVNKRDSTKQLAGGKKKSLRGSTLDIIYPLEAVWDEGVTNYVYPFIFTSDSDWTIDVCTQIPTGYSIVGVYDEDLNLLTTTDCAQTFVTGETRVIAFDVTQVGSPNEFTVGFTLKAKDPKGKVHNVSLPVPSKLTGPPPGPPPGPKPGPPPGPKPGPKPGPPPPGKTKAASINGSSATLIEGGTLWGVAEQVLGNGAGASDIMRSAIELAIENAIKVPEWGINLGTRLANTLGIGTILKITSIFR
ncbi:right-handed parallel beta-helix repeat-containing protein [Patescibacteria group bacterium]|nr:right-handed parallel beta-helix repeat-containing protein [Patescibacteria group bacterium]